MNESTPKILHLASDEKFINSANYLFEKILPQSNLFIIPKSRFSRDFRYVTPNINIKRVYFGGTLIKKLSRLTNAFDCVFLHGLTEINGNVFLLAKEKNKFIGILWGAELYTEDNFPKEYLLGNKTAQIKLPIPDPSFAEKMKEKIRRLVYHNDINLKDASKLTALNLRYLCVPYKEEFDFFSDKKIISEDCNQILFSYYPLEFILKGNESETVTGNDILVGNSASSSNNHIEAFDILQNLETGERRIIVPLSYGNSQYADYIEGYGKKLFNTYFLALRKFMPLSEYTKFLVNCGIVIMNHYRQQGFGNVVALLYLGSKLYLNESNTIYQYLKRIGVKIFSIEKDLKTENKSVFLNLTKQEIENNRSILKSELSEETIIERLKKDLSVIIASD